jgi:hypothetical protein
MRLPPTLSISTLPLRLPILLRRREKRGAKLGLLQLKVSCWFFAFSSGVYINYMLFLSFATGR